MKWIPTALYLTVLLFLGCVEPETLGGLKRLLYETPGRDDWAQPERVIETLDVAPGARVADLGAGGGYFTYRLAEAVGPGGRVYAIDVDASLLAYVERQAAKRGLDWIETVPAPPDALGVSDAAVDLVFLSNVFHHLPDQAAYFRRARSALRPGGRIAIVEADRGGRHSTSPEVIADAMREAGYVLVARHAFLEQQSFQVFASAPTPAPAGEGR